MLLDATGLEHWQAIEPPPEPSLLKLRAGALAADVALARSPNRLRFLSADGQTPTSLELEAILDTNDLVEASFIERCALVMTCIGRVRFRTAQGKGYATGFLIAPGLMMTNHHVFPTREAASAASIEFDYRRNVAGKLPQTTSVFELDASAFYVSDAALDFAVVGVSPRSTTGAELSARSYLRLIPESGKAEKGDFVTIIQHPEGAPMQVALRENEVTQADQDKSYIWYRADTAHGSSGAPVLNDSFQICALHASGHIRRTPNGEYALVNGGSAQSLNGLREDDVVWDANVGIRVSRICANLIEQTAQRWPGHAAVLEAAMRGGDILANAVDRAQAGAGETEMSEVEDIMPIEPRKPTTAELSSSVSPPGAYSASVVVPLQIRITVEAVGAGVAPGLTPASVLTVSDAELAAEKFQMQIPIIYDGLEEREGFDATFLDLQDGKSAPAPRLTAAGKRAAAPLLDGSGHELKYSHFSVWMNKSRRIAMYTAANIDWRGRKAKVDGKPTDRKSLGGFPNDKVVLEEWVTDLRIEPRHQLPDIFYSEDRGAFDKGHLVRRDDVCWGETYEAIQMSNGDTYHVTNCSPQIKVFNQSTAGEENWGDLENHVQKATKKDQEKAIIYSGPVFGKDDRWFHGVDDDGSTRVQIPSRYWKVVVVKSASGPEAYGFVIDQDVRAITETEFRVSDEWIGSLWRISDIHDLLRGWVTLTDLAKIDAYDSVDGV